ncbi:adenosine kinase [Litorivivens sp.]|uniref:adenosine kinase n=1 Tax=Litorivivens sp. TaxID=2020868 RepID=UPI0035650625
MRKYHVYGLGAALVDTEIEVSDQDLTMLGVDKGVMTLVDRERQETILNTLEGHLIHAKQASGGSAANSIIAASYFGAKTFYSCKVADDALGEFYMNDLRAAGVDANYSQKSVEGVTGTCLVMITPDAERSMNTYLGISETLSASELHHAALKDSEYLYMEGYLVTSPTGRAAAIEAREMAQANGVKTALSFSDPGMVEFFRDGLQEMLGGGVDMIFCNQDEALGWAQSSTLNDAVAALKKVARTFAITLGAKGALVFDGEQLIEIEPRAVSAVDTNGAGDMFAGAFLYGITNGLNFADAGRLASISAAEVVSNYGPRLPAAKHGELLATA